MPKNISADEVAKRSTEHYFLRLFVWSFLGLAGLGALGTAGFFGFQHWHQHRLLHRADGFLAFGDTHSASMLARQILQSDPSQPQACRIMATVAERNGQADAVAWRQRVIARLPDSAPDQIALARSALQFGNVAAAQSALDHVAGRSEKEATYHEARAQLAVAKKDPAAAQKEYAEASRLDPGNKLYAVNLAVFELQSADAAVRLNASQFLQGLLDNKTVRVPAARALLNYAIQRRDPALVEIGGVLADFPESTFQDRVFYLHILQQLDSPEATGLLTRLQEEAAADPNKLTDFLSWMSNNQKSLLAVDWSKRLPESTLKKRPVFVAVADCYVAAADCAGLEGWCKKFEWQELEFLRHAYLARALLDCEKPLDSDLEWSKAIKATANGDDLFTLERDAAKWNWQDKAIDLLWLLSKNSDKQRPALAALYQHYSERSDTRNLYRVASRMSQVAPEDAAVQNNYAQLCLILNVEPERAREIAKQLHQTDPANPGFASTYAYALVARGLPQEALKVMKGLTNEQLRRPEIAAYYALVLAAAGNRPEAASFFETGRKAKLLPEEKALLDKAQDRIN